MFHGSQCVEKLATMALHTAIIPEPSSTLLSTATTAPSCGRLYSKLCGAPASVEAPVK
jgi:hypothetical protein